MTKSIFSKKLAKGQFWGEQQNAHSEAVFISAAVNLFKYFLSKIRIGKVLEQGFLHLCADSQLLKTYWSSKKRMVAFGKNIWSLSMTLADKRVTAHSAPVWSVSHSVNK